MNMRKIKDENVIKVTYSNSPTEFYCYDAYGSIYEMQENVNMHVANYNCMMQEKQDAKSVKEVLARIL